MTPLDVWYWHALLTFNALNELTGRDEHLRGLEGGMSQ